MTSITKLATFALTTSLFACASMFPRGGQSAAPDPAEGAILVQAYEASVHLTNGASAEEFTRAESEADRCASRRDEKGRALKTLFDKGRELVVQTSDGPMTVDKVVAACKKFRDVTLRTITRSGCALQAYTVNAEVTVGGAWAPEQFRIAHEGFYSTSCDFPAANPTPSKDLARYKDDLKQRCPGATRFWIPSNWYILHGHDTAPSWEQTAADSRLVTGRTATLYCFFPEAERAHWVGAYGTLHLE